jgi:hypothetical protein
LLDVGLTMCECAGVKVTSRQSSGKLDVHLRAA